MAWFFNKLKNIYIFGPFSPFWGAKKESRKGRTDQFDRTYRTHVQKHIKTMLKKSVTTFLVEKNIIKRLQYFHYFQILLRIMHLKMTVTPQANPALPCRNWTKLNVLVLTENNAYKDDSHPSRQPCSTLSKLNETERVCILGLHQPRNINHYFDIFIRITNNKFFFTFLVHKMKNSDLKKN